MIHDDIFDVSATTTLLIFQRIVTSMRVCSTALILGCVIVRRITVEAFRSGAK